MPHYARHEDMPLLDGIQWFTNRIPADILLTWTRLFIDALAFYWQFDACFLSVQCCSFEANLRLFRTRLAKYHAGRFTEL